MRRSAGPATCRSSPRRRMAPFKRVRTATSPRPPAMTATAPSAAASPRALSAMERLYTAPGGYGADQMVWDHVAFRTFGVGRGAQQGLTPGRPPDAGRMRAHSARGQPAGEQPARAGAASGAEPLLRPGPAGRLSPECIRARRRRVAEGVYARARLPGGPTAAVWRARWETLMSHDKESAAPQTSAGAGPRDRQRRGGAAGLWLHEAGGGRVPRGEAHRCVVGDRGGGRRRVGAHGRRVWARAQGASRQAGGQAGTEGPDRRRCCRGRGCAACEPASGGSGAGG